MPAISPAFGDADVSLFIPTELSTVGDVAAAAAVVIAAAVVGAATTSVKRVPTGVVVGDSAHLQLPLHSQLLGVASMEEQASPFISSNQ